MKRLRNKYHAKKTAGYDSKKEHKRAKELELLARAGVIKDLQKQVRFTLQSGFRLNGTAIRAITYIADFVYTKGSEIIIEDVKGYKTKEYQIKRKMLLKLIAEGKINARFVES